VVVGYFVVLSQMGMNSVAETVCRMASEFYRLRNVSMIDLLKSSGYLQDPSVVLEQELEEVFRAYPDLINDWARLSEDKRTSDGWYLVRPFDSHDGADWIVGYDPKRWKQRKFPDGFKACAFFVKQEIEVYRANV
jgi:hypothetical protein